MGLFGVEWRTVKELAQLGVAMAILNGDGKGLFNVRWGCSN
jgi:hypothetical protein